MSDDRSRLACHVLPEIGSLDVRTVGRDTLENLVERLDAKVRAGKLEMIARTVNQRFQSLRQHVAELLSVQAGSTHTTVEGASVTSAESSTLLTKNKVTINGKAIHLG